MLPKWDHNTVGHFRCLAPQLKKSKNFLSRVLLFSKSGHGLERLLCILMFCLSAYAFSEPSQSKIVGETGKVLLEWQEVSGASAYYVEIASDQEFEQILFSKTLMGTTLQWEFEHTGVFYLHVATINAQGLVGSFTDPIEIQIVESIPKIVPEPLATTIAPKTKAPIKKAISTPKPVAQPKEVVQKPAAPPRKQPDPPAKPSKQVDAKLRRGIKLTGYFKPTLWNYQLSGLPTKTKLSGVMFNSGGVSVEGGVNSWVGFEAGYAAAGTEILKDSVSENPVFVEMHEMHLGLSLQRDVLTSGRFSFGVGGGQRSFPLLLRDSSGKVQHQQITASSLYADLMFQYAFTSKVRMNSRLSYEHSLGSATVKSSSHYLIGTEMYFLPSSTGMFLGGGAEFALYNAVPKQLYEDHQAKVRGSLQSLFFAVGLWLPSSYMDSRVDSRVDSMEQIKSLPQKRGAS